MDVSRRYFDARCGPDGAFLAGDPGAAVAKVRTASDALGGVSRLSFQMSAASGDHAAMTRAIAVLGSAVAPQLRPSSSLAPNAAARSPTGAASPAARPSIHLVRTFS